MITIIILALTQLILALTLVTLAVLVPRILIERITKKRSSGEWTIVTRNGRKYRRTRRTLVFAVPPF